MGIYINFYDNNLKKVFDIKMSVLPLAEDINAMFSSIIGTDVYLMAESESVFADIITEYFEKHLSWSTPEDYEKLFNESFCKYADGTKRDWEYSLKQWNNYIKTHKRIIMSVG